MSSLSGRAAAGHAGQWVTTALFGLRYHHGLTILFDARPKMKRWDWDSPLRNTLLSYGAEAVCQESAKESARVLESSSPHGRAASGLAYCSELGCTSAFGAP